MHEDEIRIGDRVVCIDPWFDELVGMIGYVHKVQDNELMVTDQAICDPNTMTWGAWCPPSYVRVVNEGRGA